MTIIVETGEGLDDANSYLDVAEANEFADSRQLTLPVVDDDVKALIFRATDYVESFSSRFPGYKFSDTQGLSYPRDDNGVPATIPKELKQAVIYTMVGINAGFDPVENKSSTPFVTRESVDVLRVDYAESSQYNKNRLPMVDKLLNLLFGGGSVIRFVKG